MERKLTTQSQRSSASNKSSTKVIKKQVTSNAAQEILSQLEADVRKESEMSERDKKSESFFDEDGEGSDGVEDVRIKADDLIFNPESQQR